MILEKKRKKKIKLSLSQNSKDLEMKAKRLKNKIKLSKKTDINKKVSVTKSNQKKIKPVVASSKAKIDIVQNLNKNNIAAREMKQENRKEKKSGIQYREAIGRRKTSVARVRVVEKGNGVFLINNHPLERYCPNLYYRKTLDTVLEMIRSKKISNRPDITIIVKGGGFHSQLEAIRHAIAKILSKIDEKAKKKVKQLGYLTRDDRMRERKKPGLKRARKATQWRKR